MRELSPEALAYLGLSKEDLEDHNRLEQEEVQREEAHRLRDRAVQALKQLEGEGLFLEIVRQIQQELVDSIFAMDPKDKDEFTVTKAKLDILYEPLNRLRMMAEATEQPEGGIL